MLESAVLEDKGLVAEPQKDLTNSVFVVQRYQSSHRHIRIARYN